MLKDITIILITIKGPDFTELIQYSDGSYDIDAIQKAIYDRHKELDPTIKESKPPICIYVNKTSNRITLHLDKGYDIDFMSPEMMRVVGSDKQKYSGPYDTDLPLVPHVEKVDVVNVNCSIVDNPYQIDSRLLYSFTPKTSYGTLLSEKPTFPIFCDTLQSKLREVEYGYQIKMEMIWL